ncbi:MAG: hypothetical protein V1799_19230 [bacterium]
MKKIKYIVSIKGLDTPQGSITFSALKHIINALSVGSERALRLVLEGESVKKGPIPEWLARSSDFVLTGVRKGSTSLVIQAPQLGDIAPEQIKQQDLWNEVPSPEDTALSILSKSVRDANRENYDSDRYDPGVLDALLECKRLLNGDDIQIKISSKERATEGFTLKRSAFDKIEALKLATPEPQAVLISGFFDMIQHSRRRFTLRMENNEVVRGKIDEGSFSVESMRDLWGKKVTIKGTMYYAASKKPRLIEAQVIVAQRAGDEILRDLKLPLQVSEVITHLHKESHQGIVSEIWGKWPGDESTEQILEALKERKTVN